jgi:signal transduction histidine kinase
MKSSSLDAQTINMLQIANSNCDRLVRLVNDVLDVEKIESGKLGLHIDETDLVEVLREVEQINRDLAAGKYITIETQFGENALLVPMDRDRIMQALQNLVSNAIKFSPKHSRVTMQLERLEDSVRVSISDQGPGIPTEFAEKVFDRFSQAESIDTRKQGGSGLGLSITRSIIRQHGGNIGFRNHPGAGVTFFFTLPLMQGSVVSKEDYS